MSILRILLHIPLNDDYSLYFDPPTSIRQFSLFTYHNKHIQQNSRMWASLMRLFQRCDLVQTGLNVTLYKENDAC